MGQLSVRIVSYNIDGMPETVTSIPAALQGQEIYELVEHLELMQDALRKPIIEEEYFILRKHKIDLGFVDEI